MPFTTNDRVKFSISALSMLLYLLFVYNVNGGSKSNDIIIEKRLNCLKNKFQIEGLVCGGSNAFFGISASQLTKKSNHLFINLSLHGEGGNANNYFNYISKTTEHLDHNKIKWIIFSTISFYDNKIEQREVDINGEKRAIANYLIPDISLFSTLLRKPNASLSDLMININSYGDKEFQQSSKVRFIPDFVASPNQMSVLRHIVLLNDNYRKLFPHARIIFVFPPVLSHNLSPMEKYQNMMQQELKKYGILTFIHQSNGYDSSLWVDNQHVNEKGRIFRTTDLFDSLNKQGWFD
jgi:hypothetical protein